MNGMDYGFEGFLVKLINAMLAIGTVGETVGTVLLWHIKNSDKKVPSL